MPPRQLGDAEAESFGTENIDTARHLGGWALEVVKPNTFFDVAGDYRNNNQIETSAMVQDHQGEINAHRMTGAIGSRMFITDESGTMELLGQHANGPIQELVPNIVGEWLVEQATTYVYGSLSDATAGTPAGSSTEPAQPLTYNTVPFFDPNESSPWNIGWIMADYGGGDPTTPRVWKVLRNGTFHVQLDPGVRHFHSFDWDPWNPGEGYVTSGDNDVDVRWWKCTGWGETSTTTAADAWTELTAASGDQTYRTLRINFPENDGLYWGMDYPGATFYTAARNDLANPTALFDPGDLVDAGTPNWDPLDLRVYGSTYIPEFEVIVVGYQDTESAGAYETVPLGLWDLERQEARLLTQLPTDYTMNAQPGVVALSPYADQKTGEFYAMFRGVPNARGENILHRSYRVQRLMG